METVPIDQTDEITDLKIIFKKNNDQLTCSVVWQCVNILNVYKIHMKKGEYTSQSE